MTCTGSGTGEPSFALSDLPRPLPLKDAHVVPYPPILHPSGKQVSIRDLLGFVLCLLLLHSIHIELSLGLVVRGVLLQL